MTHKARPNLLIIFADILTLITTDILEESRKETWGFTSTETIKVYQGWE